MSELTPPPSPRSPEGRGSARPEPDELLDGLRTGQWLDSQEFEPVEWILPGVIPEGLTLAVGPPKIGKSWLLLALLLGCAFGGRALGLQVTRRPVLYLALEDGHRRMQDRCRKLLEDDESIPRKFEYLVRLEPLNLSATLRAWLDTLEPGAKPLIVVDTLGKVKPPADYGEGAYQHDYRVASAIKRIADERPGSAIVLVHHDRKAESTDFVEKVSGSNGLAGAADTIVVITRKRHERDGRIAVTGRDVGEGEYAVTFDGAHGAWRLAGGTLEKAAKAAAEQRSTQGIGDDAAKVIQLAADSDNGIRAKDVAAYMDWSEPKARTYLSRLADSGRLLKVSRGLYTPVASVASVASEVSDLVSGTSTNATNGDGVLRSETTNATSGDELLRSGPGVSPSQPGDATLATLATPLWEEEVDDPQLPTEGER